MPGELKIVPLTPSRWDDFAALFGPRGACAGCWCMFWRRTRAEWERGRGEGNRRALHALVRTGAKPGLLAYAGSEAVGWVSVAPRATFAGLASARTLKPVDDEPVWSVSCLFVKRDWRGRGVSVALLSATIDFVRKQGGRIVEGYPRDVRSGRQADAFLWNGTINAFHRAGFTEVARPSPTRAIMRRDVRRPAS
ncbi:MAG TPA: GNAT family N-acetyltransferase [Opitutaceae bacterium]